MFYKLFFYILIAIAVLVTLGLCTMQPQMHTALFVYDSAYTIEGNENKNDSVKEVAKATTVTETPKVEKKVETIPKVQTKQIQKQDNALKKVVKTIPNKQQTKVVNKTVQPKPQVKVEKKVQQPVQQVKTQTKPVTQQVKQKTATAQKPVQQVKTSTQEEIEWNKWRSNIQNKIMQDVKLPIVPQGTIFKFSFDVDKYGRITNVNTWSMTPSYTPYAINCIAPVIRSYQGRSLLNFPAGTNRVTTTVTGQWKISNSQKYSTSSNFHDVEVIQKGN